MEPLGSTRLVSRVSSRRSLFCRSSFVLHSWQFLAVAIWLTACVSTTDPGPPPGARTTGAPVFAVGDQWVRSDGIYDLISADANSYLFAAGPDNVVRLTRALSIERVYRRLESDEQALLASIPLRAPPTR